jgi:hypothetical protein
LFDEKKEVSQKIRNRPSWDTFILIEEKDDEDEMAMNAGGPRE